MKYENARERMVRQQIEGRGIDDPRLLEAMRQVPRECFIDEKFRVLAYRDGPIPIGRGQTISQPYVVALMTDALDVQEGARILEVGTGSGYQAAVLAQMGAQVWTIERHNELADRARRRLADAGYDAVDVISGDGSNGLADKAPFDAIIVTAAGPTIPTPLLEQLKVEGRLVIPVEDEPARQSLVRITRREDGRYDREELGKVAFVPLIGEEGWDEGRESYWQ